MIQHINLLSQRSRRQGYERLAFWAVVAVFLGLLGWAGNNELHLQQLVEADVKMQRSVDGLKQALEKKRRGDGGTGSQAVGEQIAALRAQINARQDWSELMDKGELGTSLAYSQLMSVLAGLHQEGLWLQGMDVGKGGQAVSIQGQALNSAAVMRYIAQVNEAFKSMNIQFSSVEITQDSSTVEAAQKAGTGLLKFKLY